MMLGAETVYYIILENAHEIHIMLAWYELKIGQIPAHEIHIMLAWYELKIGQIPANHRCEISVQN